jgi:peptide/nickel transport system permease protein
MRQYLVRRVLQAIPLLFLISVLLFVLMQSVGDPLATLGGDQRLAGEERRRLERLLGLDEPLVMQYLYWLVGNDWARFDTTGDGVPNARGARRGVLRGDFGRSIVTRQPAASDILARLPATLILMVSAQVLTLVLSLSLGIFSAVRKYSFWDNALTSFFYVFQSLPIFWIALVLLHLGAVQLRAWGLPFFPAGGMYDPRRGMSALQVGYHLVLPVLSLSLVSVAYYSRYVRAAMLEVINQDFIRTARAKGLREAVIMFKHAFRNAMLPVVTLIGLDIPGLFAGALVTEKIYAWPGTGSLFIDRLARSDYPVLMGLLMLISLLVVISQLATDLVYALLDPRIRY